MRKLRGKGRGGRRVLEPGLRIPAGIAVAVLAGLLASSIFVLVTPGRGADSMVTLDLPLASGADDVEEDSAGTVNTGSDDLELVVDGTPQTVGLRYARVDVPVGSVIEAAWVQFTSDETNLIDTRLSVSGEALPALPFTSTMFTLTLRLRTATRVPWTPPPWTKVGDAGVGQRTPNLRGVVQEIVNGPLWATGSAMALFISGAGKRVAEAFEAHGRPPVLHIQFWSPRPGPTPSASPSTTPTPTLTPTPGSGRVWRVPGDAATVQQGVDRAANGDTVLVAPGTYLGNVNLPAKAITLASHFATTGDANLVAQTILDGGITVSSSAGFAPTINGFTIRGATDGVKATGPFHLGNCRITQTGDGIDLSGAQGVVIRNNLFDANSDDAIDFDGASSGIVEGNTLYSNGDDGIEVRLHSYTGPTLQIIIKDNKIDSNREDGIQLIDYDGLSSRTFRIEGNLIIGNAMSGLGLMADGNSNEDFSGASMPEPIETFNNTFANNPYAITGGDNMTVRNNLFMGSTRVGLKNVDASSTVAYNLFWNNAVNSQGSNIDSAKTLYADPRIDPSYRLRPGSPAINAGTNVGRPYAGPAPDLGAFEAA
jgi:parallel beta-helix repeat protein